MPPEIYVTPNKPNRLLQAARKYGAWGGLGGLAIGAAVYLHHEQSEQTPPPPQPTEVITRQPLPTHEVAVEQ